jgi:hypothetical protein
MNCVAKFLKLYFLLTVTFLISTATLSEEKDIFETLEIIKKDIKTLEKAVYSGSLQSNSNSNIDNSEDVLTRHLLKLSEIENQFQQLTNKFEEINFKLDKLSNRLSKVQADNQIRFQDLEKGLVTDGTDRKISQKTDELKNNNLPGSSQPQDLGSVSYKDTETNETSQKIQSVDTTATIVTETFQAEEKILPNEDPKKQY